MKKANVAQKKAIVDEMLEEMRAMMYRMLEVGDKHPPPIVVLVASLALLEEHFEEQDPPLDTHFSGALEAMKTIERLVES